MLCVYINGVEQWSQDGLGQGWRLPAGGVLAEASPGTPTFNSASWSDLACSTPRCIPRTWRRTAVIGALRGFVREQQGGASTMRLDLGTRQQQWQHSAGHLHHAFRNQYAPRAGIVVSDVATALVLTSFAMAVSEVPHPFALTSALAAKVTIDVLVRAGGHTVYPWIPRWMMSCCRASWTVRSARFLAVVLRTSATFNRTS